MGEPANYTVEQFQRLFKCTGLLKTGKEKRRLARTGESTVVRAETITSSINGKWLEAKIFSERNAECLTSSTKTVTDVPLIPKTGWKAFLSQDLPQ